MIAKDGLHAFVAEALIESSDKVQRATRIRSLVYVVPHENKRGCRFCPVPLLRGDILVQPIDQAGAPHPGSGAMSIGVKIADGPDSG